MTEFDHPEVVRGGWQDVKSSFICVLACLFCCAAVAQISNSRIFSDAVLHAHAINVKLCFLVVLIEFLSFIPS